MIRTLSLLRNVGRFDNDSSGATLPFARLTLIYAENARGKTTLAAILRSLATGRPDLILERRRLGAQHPPHIVVELDGRGAAIFQNRSWSQTAPEIVIFDDVFVAENVCSGIEVAATHRQNLHGLIVGAQGIALNNALQAEVAKIEEHNRKLHERSDAIPAHRRGDMDADTFCALKPVADLAQKIEAAERRLAAGRAAGRVAEMAIFPPVLLPTIDLKAIEAVLRRGLADLDAAALERVQAHLARLGTGGEAWVGEGMDLAKVLEGHGSHECPFCAQDLGASPVMAHYRGYFGEAYNKLKQEIAGVIGKFDAAHGGDVPAVFERTIRQAIERQSFWKDFAAVPVIEIDTQAIALAWKTAREAVRALLEAKRTSPLDSAAISDQAISAVAAYNAHCQSIDLVNTDLQRTNAALELVKEQAREANVATLADDLEQLKSVESRFSPAVIPLCDAYLAEKTGKAATEQARRTARATLDDYRQAAFPAYGVAINDFLQRFNASFRVGPVDAINTRGGSTAIYTMLIDGNPVPLSGADGDPSFRNTLSAGDRNTLALAFFFASLESDPNRAQKIVVIDDPMTSLDEHRTLHTLQEMDRLARETVGMIVLSHSKPFLLGVWDKCQQLQKAALTIIRAGPGSTLAPWNVTDAAVTEHDRRYLGAVAYLQQADPGAARQVAESLRPMLETFARVAYPPEFPPGTLLGPFHTQCVQRLGTPSEIMGAVDAQELRAILDFANRYHHEENAAFATELINDAELFDFTRRTLNFIRQ